VLLVVAGCDNAPGPVEVRGTITQKGKPISVRKMVGRVDVRFYPDVPKRSKNDLVDPYFAAVRPDGTFWVPGRDGMGIPPGKYRITITWTDAYPMGPDRLKGRFNQAHSRILRDVTGGEEIHLDVSRPGG
jgi:hypothetical protein